MPLASYRTMADSAKRYDDNESGKGKEERRAMSSVRLNIKAC